jgi:excisionase family DNA binding protein
VCEVITKQLSTSEVASAMGVGESSVKRWIDSGRLAAEKTPGGHRRVALTELYNFIRASGKKLVDPDALGIKPILTGAKSPLEACQASLAAGDAFTFESTLQLLRLTEPTLAAILDKTVYPAFQAVRATCQHPSEECLTLHRAISMTETALRVALPADRAKASKKIPRVVLADVGYEVDGIPTILAEASISDQAQCLQLGTNVPVTVINGALKSFGADLLWLSASGPVRRSTLESAFTSILSTAKRSGMKVVVFGDAVPKSLGTSAIQLSSFGEFRGYVAALR